MSKSHDETRVSMQNSATSVYKVCRDDGSIRPARQVRSPNQDDRPEGCVPQLIVVHGISLPPGEFGGPWIEQLFTNCLDWSAHEYFEGMRGLEVSAHLLVRRDGELVQFVPFDRRAWHAGLSAFRGRARCNDYSIGIELEGTDDTAYSDEQYRVLAAVLLALVEAYPGLDARHIAAHSDVAPGRKSDPGPAFDWFRLYDDLTDRHQAQNPSETV